MICHQTDRTFHRERTDFLFRCGSPYKGSEVREIHLQWQCTAVELQNTAPISSFNAPCRNPPHFREGPQSYHHVRTPSALIGRRRSLLLKGMKLFLYLLCAGANILCKRNTVGIDLKDLAVVKAVPFLHRVRFSITPPN